MEGRGSRLEQAEEGAADPYLSKASGVGLLRAGQTLPCFPKIKLLYWIFGRIYKTLNIN